MGTVTIDHDYIRRVYGADSSTKIYMPDCTELTGFLRPPCESDWGYLDWNMNHDAIIHREVATNPSRTVDYEEQGIDRLILRLKSQPPARQPRMAVTETDVYGPNIPPIPKGWEDNGFCIIREELHEAYLGLNGEARDTKKYALVGMVRIALKRKPQPPAPDLAPDPLAPGNCFYGSVHGTYLKVITEPRWESTINTTARQYLQLYPGCIDPISLRWLPDTAMPYSGGPSIYRPIPKAAFLNQLLGVLESVDGRGVKV